MRTYLSHIKTVRKYAAKFQINPIDSVKTKIIDAILAQDGAFTESFQNNARSNLKNDKPFSQFMDEADMANVESVLQATFMLQMPEIKGKYTATSLAQEIHRRQQNQRKFGIKSRESDISTCYTAPGSDAAFDMPALAPTR